jgi:hypothetical protein
MLNNLFKLNTNNIIQNRRFCIDDIGALYYGEIRIDSNF